MNIPNQMVYAKGHYMVPGLIDGHMHVEGSMIDPRHFAEAVLPGGVTTICPDCHEIANVLGLRAVKLFHDVAQGLPIKFLHENVDRILFNGRQHLRYTEGSHRDREAGCGTNSDRSQNKAQ